MRFTGKVLLIDDDPSSLDVAEFALRRRFPGLEIERRSCPDASGDFDVYLIDDDFQGERLALTLANQVRAARPEALILAYSAVLDAPLLKGLLNAGCSGAFDKSEPGDLADALEVIDVYLKSVHARAAQGRGFLGAARAITDLLREWNHRLEGEDLVVGGDAAAKTR